MTLADWTFAKTAQGDFRQHLIGYVLQAMEKYLWDVSGFMIKELRKTSKGYQIGRVTTQSHQLFFNFTYRGDGSELDAPRGPVSKGRIVVTLSAQHLNKGEVELDLPNDKFMWGLKPMKATPEQLMAQILGPRAASDFLGTNP